MSVDRTESKSPGQVRSISLGVRRLSRRTPLLVGTSLAVWLNAAPASAADDWWGEDKLLHFGVSMLLASGGYAASSFVLEEPWQRALAGGAFSLSLGIAKESFDLAGHGDPSWKDLTWDGAGTLVAEVSVTVARQSRNCRLTECNQRGTPSSPNLLAVSSLALC
jgi:uncharacterized protein YfiM (DUF2279 family)